MANLRLKKQIIEIVENQIKLKEPPCTKHTFLQLQEQGYTKKEAKERIASVLLEEMYYVIKEGRTFNEKRYEKQLRKIVAEKFLLDELSQGFEGDTEGILRTKDRIYDAIYGQKPIKAIKLFMKIWDEVKRFIIENFYRENRKGNLIKPEILDIDDETDFEYDFYNWFYDMEMEFDKTELYEERIRFCQEVIELFAWKEDSAEDYKAGIGKALNGLKRYKECDEWFESWLMEEPDNVSCISIYIDCALSRQDLEKAKSLTQKYISASIEFNEVNEVLLYRAIEVYEKAGEAKKVEEYQELLKEYKKWYEENMDFFDDDYEELLYFNESVVKEKKIYPNDPCLCGSGKKYKKCCGR